MPALPEGHLRTRAATVADDVVAVARSANVHADATARELGLLRRADLVPRDVDVWHDHGALSERDVALLVALAAALGAPALVPAAAAAGPAPTAAAAAAPPAAAPEPLPRRAADLAAAPAPTAAAAAAPPAGAASEALPPPSKKKRSKNKPVSQGGRAADPAAAHAAARLWAASLLGSRQIYAGRAGSFPRSALTMSGNEQLRAEQERAIALGGDASRGDRLDADRSLRALSACRRALNAVLAAATTAAAARALPPVEAVALQAAGAVWRESRELREEAEQCRARREQPPAALRLAVAELGRLALQLTRVPFAVTRSLPPPLVRRCLAQYKRLVGPYSVLGPQSDGYAIMEGMERIADWDQAEGWFGGRDTFLGILKDWAGAAASLADNDDDDDKDKDEGGNEGEQQQQARRVVVVLSLSMASAAVACCFPAPPMAPGGANPAREALTKAGATAAADEPTVRRLSAFLAECLRCEAGFECVGGADALDGPLSTMSVRYMAALGAHALFSTLARSPAAGARASLPAAAAAAAGVASDDEAAALGLVALQQVLEWPLCFQPDHESIPDYERINDPDRLTLRDVGVSAQLAAKSAAAFFASSPAAAARMPPEGRADLAKLFAWTVRRKLTRDGWPFRFFESAQLRDAVPPAFRAGVLEEMRPDRGAAAASRSSSSAGAAAPAIPAPASPFALAATVGEAELVRGLAALGSALAPAASAAAAAAAAADDDNDNDDNGGIAEARARAETAAAVARGMALRATEAPSSPSSSGVDAVLLALELARLDAAVLDASFEPEVAARAASQLAPAADLLARALAAEPPGETELARRSAPLIALAEAARAGAGVSGGAGAGAGAGRALTAVRISEAVEVLGSASDARALACLGALGTGGGSTSAAAVLDGLRRHCSWMECESNDQHEDDRLAAGGRRPRASERQACGRCRAAFYCNAMCRRAALAAHKHFCPLLAEARKPAPA